MPGGGTTLRGDGARALKAAVDLGLRGGEELTPGGRHVWEAPGCGGTGGLLLGHLPSQKHDGDLGQSAQLGGSPPAVAARAGHWGQIDLSLSDPL